MFYKKTHTLHKLLSLLQACQQSAICISCKRDNLPGGYQSRMCGGLTPSNFCPSCQYSFVLLVIIWLIGKNSSLVSNFGKLNSLLVNFLQHPLTQAIQHDTAACISHNNYPPEYQSCSLCFVNPSLLLGVQITGIDSCENDKQCGCLQELQL